MLNAIKAIIYYYVILGLEQEDMYYNSFTKHKKPNIVYRICKRFNRDFRNEANAYVFRYDKNKVTKHRWTA